jgi:hypothetical protein
MAVVDVDGGRELCAAVGKLVDVSAGGEQTNTVGVILEFETGRCECGGFACGRVEELYAGAAGVDKDCVVDEVGFLAAVAVCPASK